MTTIQRVRERPIEYPDSDGEPMSDNDLQFEWISTIKWNLDDMLRDDPDVYVAGDMLWYPVEGHPEIRVAPDALVAFGRPKGYRGSYKQWEEGGIAPQVVIEVLSMGNRVPEMMRKLAFYDRHGVEEYYVIDPYVHRLDVWSRTKETGRLDPNELPTTTWRSARLGILFDRSGTNLVMYRPNGERFQSYLELADVLRRAEERAEAAMSRADAEASRADAEAEKVARLQARLRELGLDPDA